MKNEPIAIVGIGAIFPGAKNYADFWNNGLSGECFVREVPEDYWKKEYFYDPDPSVPDKTYAKNAGVLDPIEFDAMEFGIPPKTMEAISVDQLFALVTAKQALVDANLYGKNARTFDKTRVGVIISASIAKNAYELSSRTNSPVLERLMKNYNIPDEIIKRIVKNYKDGIIEWNEDSNPGYLANVVSGRVANRFNFTGTTCSVDSACASGLTAVKFASQELWLGNSDIMLAGATMMDISNVSYVSFCKTPALSKSDCIRPFDSRADGMLLGDGSGIVVLKRLSKAEEDNDKIYALIEGVGSSSDGREKNVFSPSKKGQMLAITRALDNANVEPKQIGMIEAHGTATLVGDTCEVEALSEIFNKENSKKRRMILTGCKGQTGHMRLAAGISSLIRTSLALYHKQFLPLAGCEILNPAVEKSNMYVCKKPRPWIVNRQNPDRYAGVSAFGFGGTNYNIVLKEYKSDYSEPYRYTNMPYAVIIAGKDEQSLIEELLSYIEMLKESPEQIKNDKFSYRDISADWARIAFVVNTAQEAIEKASYSVEYLKKQEYDYLKIKDIFYAKQSFLQNNKVMAMFPGQGSQYLGMFANTTGNYPEMRSAFTEIDNAMIDIKSEPISEVVYAKACTTEEIENAKQQLVLTKYTQPALAAVEMGLYNLMKNRGFLADYMVGHSFGELVALYAGGVYDKEELGYISVMRGKFMSEASVKVETGMTAVMADYDYVKEKIASYENVYIANENSPNQTIICGDAAQLEEVEKKIEADRKNFKRLNVQSAFHSKFMQSAKEPFGEILKDIKYSNPNCKIFSNYKAEVYQNAEEIYDGLYNQLVNPVLFKSGIEKAYKEGVRVFVEVGPGKVLSNLVRECLTDKVDCVTVTVNADKKKDDAIQLESALAYLAVLGMSIKKDCYRKEINPEIINKKTATTYTVPTTYFLLPETKKRIDSVRNSKPEKKDTILAYKQDILVNEEEDNEEMKKYDAICEIQKLNADVFKNYINIQNDQLEKLNKMLQKDVHTSEKNALINCISNFQNNSLSALQTYFEGQKNVLSGSYTQEEISAVSDSAAAKHMNFDGDNARSISLDSDSVAAVRSKNFESDNERYAKGDNRAAKELHEIEVQSIESDTLAKTGEVSKEDIKDIILKNISEITGYPEDMIEENMMLEGDLGIDSIKRLELFSNINDKLGNIFGQEDMAALSAVQSIDECIKVVSDLKLRGKSQSASGKDIDVISLEEYSGGNED